MKKAYILLLTICIGMAAHAADYGDVFKKIKKSVVIIHTTEIMPTTSRDYSPIETTGHGSGVLVSDDGQIITAAHVIELAKKEVFVEFFDGTVLPAEIRLSNRLADVAMVQITKPLPEGVQKASIGNSDEMLIGNEVLVVGAPFVGKLALSTGHIGGIQQQFNPLLPTDTFDVFQTDAAANTGNSGGPMFNSKGELIGIVTSILTLSGGFDGISFAVAINSARKMLFERNAVWAGIDAKQLDTRMCEMLNVPAPAALLVEKIAVGSFLHSLGLKGGYVRATIDEKEYLLGGDVILSILDLDVNTMNTQYKLFHDAVKRLKSGDRFTMEILREGRKMKLKGKLP